MAYKKLVRDKIPDMIISSGEHPVTRILNDAEYKEELLRKLVEEAVELRDSSGSIDERADIAEVLRALDRAFELSTQSIEEVRRAKVNERGSFDRRIYLEAVE